jgi:hypothetical protein
MARANSGVPMQSLRLYRPPCPACGSVETRLDLRAVQNLWRVPGAVAAHITQLNIIFGEITILRRCCACSASFASDS